jgi:DNA polymerase III alpha subunit
LAQRAKAMGIGGRGAAGTVGKAAGLMRFLGPLAAIYGGYQVLDLLKQGTLDAADERRLKMMQALGAVGGGAQQQQMMNDQMRQMRFMADMAAIQNQQGLMQSRNQSISDQALSSLLRGHEASLQSLALPSQPSVAEVMARM